MTASDVVTKMYATEEQDQFDDESVTALQAVLLPSNPYNPREHSHGLLRYHRYKKQNLLFRICSVGQRS
jgi:hypothetical protein